MLNLSANGSVVVREGTRVIFLDEFRIMVFTLDVPEFTLFDTRVQPGHPVNLRRFCSPPRYHDWFLSVHVDTDRCLGTLDQGRPLVTDPSQAVLLLKLANHYGGRVLLTVRIHTLIEHLCSTNPNACVSWEVWGKGVAVMDFPILRSDGYRYLLVQGVRVILAKMCTLPGASGYHPSLRIFDFSQRGWGTLPSWGEEINGAERRVLFEDGRDFLLGERGGLVMNEWGFDKLGDGNFMYLVSHVRRWKGDGKLMPWEGQNLQFGRCATRLDAGMR